MDRYRKIINSRTTKNETDTITGTLTESDPLIQSSSHSSSGKITGSSSNSNRSGTILRSRRGTSQSPILQQQAYSPYTVTNTINLTNYLTINDNIRPMIGGNFINTTDADDTSRNRISSQVVTGGDANINSSYDMGDTTNFNDGYQSVEDSLSSIQSRQLQRLEEQHDGIVSPFITHNYHNDVQDPQGDTFAIPTSSSRGSSASASLLVEKNSSNQENPFLPQLSSTSSRRRRQVTGLMKNSSGTSFIVQPESIGGSISLSATSIPAVESAATTTSSSINRQEKDINNENDQHSEQQSNHNRQQQHLHSDDDQQLQSQVRTSADTTTIPGGIAVAPSSTHINKNEINSNINVARNPMYGSGTRSSNFNNNNNNTKSDATNSNPTSGGVGTAAATAGSGGGGGNMIVSDGRSFDSEQPPLLEIPEEVYAVRKAALQVLKPLNKTWVRINLFFLVAKAQTLNAVELPCNVIPKLYCISKFNLHFFVFQFSLYISFRL
jgi:hypothetical protein